MAAAEIGLAAAALPEFWPAASTTLFLGPWCLTPSNTDARRGRNCRMMETPWKNPAFQTQSLQEFDRVYEALLDQFRERLGRRHGLERSPRWWRIVLGPWLMAWLTTLQDRLITSRQALTEAPHAAVLFPCGPAPTARDTAEYVRWLPQESMNLHMFAAALRFLGADGPTLPAPAPARFRAGARWETPLGRVLLRAHRAGRGLVFPDAVFSSLYMNRGAQARLVASGAGRIQPLLTVLPEPPGSDASDSIRAESTAPVDSSDLAKLAAANVGSHLPSIFVEGWAEAFAALKRDWPRPPRVLLTCVGWQSDDAFKVLAAESVERGGRLAIAQHGGAYGLHDILYSERHERAIADEWWSWGWTEPATSVQPARVAPMGNPRLRRAPRAAGRRDFLLVTHALPRGSFMFYYSNVPAWPLYDRYLEHRDRFLRALHPEAQAALHVRLPVDDFGWGMKDRLRRTAPNLICEDARGPLIDRLPSVRLAVVDHPQTSVLELFAAGTPTVIFWDPTLWPMRQTALPWLDDLRSAGILHDDPESAARKATEVYADPDAWWASPAVKRAADAFQERFAARGERWTERWAQDLLDLSKESAI